MKPFPNTVLFWGAGATMSLGMCTTAQQGEVFFALSRKGPQEHYAACLKSSSAVFGSHFETVCDLLELLDDAEPGGKLLSGCRMSGFSGKQLSLLEKYGDDFGRTEEERKNRLIMMRMRYDWAAAMRVLRTNRNDVKLDAATDKEAPSDTFVQDVYCFIDANVAAGTGVHIFDDGDDSSRSDFIDVVRLRAAKAAMIMFLNLMFAAAWDGVRELDEKLQPYKNFFRLLADYRAREPFAAEKGVSHVRVVSMNFDPLFWWFMKNADEEYNRHPRFAGSGHSPLILGEEIDQVDAARPMGECLAPVAGDVLGASTARFVNEHGDRENERCLAKYQTLKTFFPHGSPNLKICHCCGKTTLYQGNELSWNSRSLFPPFFMKDVAWGCVAALDALGAEGSRRDERMKWYEGELDYVQCRNCGQGIRMCDTEMLVQSGLKMQPSWLLQRIAHDVDAEVMQAEHVILLGYSLPKDDAIWVAELKARCQRVSERVCCSLVGFHREAPAEWMGWRQLKEYQSEHKDLDMRPMEMVRSIFGEDNVRFHLQGFPAMAQNEKTLKKLLNPADWFGMTK